MHGPQGAAKIYGPQKGATNTKMVTTLENGLQKVATIFKKHKKDFDPFTQGYGAAGAIANSLSTYLNASILPGFDYISELIHLEEHIQEADLIITGEGKLDHQSLSGKVVGNLSELCMKYNKPLYVICGQTDLSKADLTQHNIREALSVKSIAKNLEHAFSHTETLIGSLARSLTLDLMNTK